MLVALRGNPGTDHLGEAVDVEFDDPQALLDLLAHPIRPRLGSEDAHPERQRPQRWQTGPRER